VGDPPLLSLGNAARHRHRESAATALIFCGVLVLVSAAHCRSLSSVRGSPWQLCEDCCRGWSEPRVNCCCMPGLKRQHLCARWFVSIHAAYPTCAVSFGMPIDANSNSKEAEARRTTVANQMQATNQRQRACRCRLRLPVRGRSLPQTNAAAPARSKHQHWRCFERTRLRAGAAGSRSVADLRPAQPWAAAASAAA